jgi:patatin-like phospholipase/acyl hydrolase
MKATILSLDGGGIRAILTSGILKALEENLQQENPKSVLADYFDMIAGTGTGGIIASAMTMPGKHSRPKYSAANIHDFFLNEGQKIFDVNLWKKLRSMGGLTDEKYSASYLDKILNTYFGKTMLSDSTTPLVITAYDIRNRAARFFTTNDTRIEGRDFQLKDICRASMATPSYFEPAKILSATDTPYAFIDGGLFANNPGMIAYAEARRLDFGQVTQCEEKPKFPGANEMFFLSVGSGQSKKPYYYEDAKDWGNIHWMKPLIDMVMSASVETVDFELQQMFRTCKEKDHYIRLNPELIKLNPDMDDTSDKNVESLKQISDSFVEDNKSMLHRTVEQLLQYGK